MLRKNDLITGCAILAALFTLAGCETMSSVDRGLYKTAEGVAGHDRVTGERTINLTSRAEQIKKSNAHSQQVLKEYDASGKKHDAALDPVAYERLLRITKRILAVSHMREETWTIVLKDDPEWNAYTEGGTYIFVLSGLMKDIQDDNELAAVLGHELAHVAANHVYEHMANRTVKSLSGRSKNKGLAAGFEAGYTVEQEVEADRIGILYAALAGYDPYAASRVWARLYAQEGNFRGGYTDHPVHSDRATQTRTVADKVKGYYTAGQQNPNFAAILEDNSLWHKPKPDVAAGKGGGFLAALEAASNTYAANAKAKAEQRRQETILRDLASLQSGMTIVAVQPIDAHSARLWFDYRGPNIQANQSVYTLGIPESDGTAREFRGTLGGWILGNRRYVVDFTDPQLDAAGIPNHRLFVKATDILR